MVNINICSPQWVFGPVKDFKIPYLHLQGDSQFIWLLTHHSSQDKVDRGEGWTSLVKGILKPSMVHGKMIALPNDSHVFGQTTAWIRIISLSTFLLSWMNTMTFWVLVGQQWEEPNQIEDHLLLKDIPFDFQNFYQGFKKNKVLLLSDQSWCLPHQNQI